MAFYVNDTAGGAELTQAQIDTYTDKLVSTTDFADVATALANSSVITAQAGDFVIINGGYYTIVKDNPTVSADLAPMGGGSSDLTNYVDKTTAQTVTGKKTYIDALRIYNGIANNGGYEFFQKSTWPEVVIMREKGTTDVNGDNWTGLTALSMPVSDTDTIANSVTDAAIATKREDSFGNTELFAMFSNGYPSGMGDSQIHGLEIQAFGSGAAAKIRDFVFLWKNNTDLGDGSYNIYQEHKISDPNDTKIVTHIPQENNIPLSMVGHNIPVNKGVCAVGSDYYLTNANSANTNNHNYIGISNKVVNADKLEIATAGSVIDLIVGAAGDKVYLNASWGGLTVTKPTAPNLILQVGVNISDTKMLLVDAAPEVASSGGGGALDSITASVQLPSGSYGGNSIVTNTWVKRLLNTIETTTAGVGSLVNNGVSLPIGQYSVDGFMVYYTPKPLQLRLRNISDGNGVTVAVGGSMYNAGNGTFNMPIKGQFEVTAQSTIDLEFFAKTSNSNGAALGWSCGSGEPEVFAMVKFTKLS